MDVHVAEGHLPGLVRVGAEVAPVKLSGPVVLLGGRVDGDVLDVSNRECEHVVDGWSWIATCGWVIGGELLRWLSAWVGRCALLWGSRLVV